MTISGMVFIVTATQHMILFLFLNCTIEINVWECSASFQTSYTCCASAEDALGLPVLASARVLVLSRSATCGLPSQSFGFIST